MSLSVSNKINRLFNRLRTSKYTGDLQNKHFAVVIRSNIAISPVLCNYSRSYVFGKARGTLHAEMNGLNYVLNSDKSVCGNVNHRLVEQCSLRTKSKGVLSKGII